MQNPDISICIANYNGEDCLKDCLESIYSQDLNASYEIIIHDDASTDGSVEYVRQSHPEVILLTSDENVGFCISNNRMVNAATGKYLLLLNNDAFLRPEALHTLFSYAEGHPEAGILSLPQHSFSDGQLLDYGCRLDPFLNPVPITTPNVQSSMVMGACLWISRELWNELNGFPEWFGSIAEDMYLCLRAWSIGYTVEVLPMSGYDHMVGKSLGGGKVTDNRLQTTYFRRSLSERNKTFVMCIFAPAGILALQLPAHLLALAIEGIIISILKFKLKIFSRIYWPAIRSVWTMRDTLQSCRLDVQRKRKRRWFEYLTLFDWLPYKLKMLFKHGLPGIK